MRLLPIIATLAAACVLLVASSCKGEDKNAPEQASKTQLSFTSGRRADGSLSVFTVKADDEVALVHAASGEKSLATPLSAGSNSATYLFGLKKPVKGDLLAAWYPSAANVSVSATSAEFDFPAVQDGSDIQTLYLGSTKNTGSSDSGNFISMNPMSALILVSVAKGAYTVQKAVLTANGGEMLAGRGTMDLESGNFKYSEPTITVNLATPVDCSNGGVVPVFVPPVTLSSGFSVELTLSNGKTSTFATNEKTSIVPGSLFSTDPTSAGRTLIACGSSKVYIFDESLAMREGRYNSALTWSWDATTAASTVGLKASRMDHIDDAKPVANGTKLLVTSSYGWTALLNIEDKKVEWSVTSTTNAHSAEMLPGGYIAVACSSDGDQVALYGPSSSVQLASYPLKSAHSVVWNEKHQRLFAIGGTSLQIYSLSNWGTPAAALKLEKTVSTKSYVTGLHDMSLVDDDTLIFGGKAAALYDIPSGKLTSLGHFATYGGVKSVNYNSSTGEAYYTYAWDGHSEGDYTWSSHKVRYTDDVFANDGGADKAVIEVDDINMYKVRVLNW